MLVHPQFNPIALDLGFFQIHWYGLTYLAAFGLFYFLATRRIRQAPYVAAGGDSLAALETVRAPLPSDRSTDSARAQAGMVRSGAAGIHYGFHVRLL